MSGSWTLMTSMPCTKITEFLVIAVVAVILAVFATNRLRLCATTLLLCARENSEASILLLRDGRPVDGLHTEVIPHQAESGVKIHLQESLCIVLLHSHLFAVVEELHLVGDARTCGVD